MTWFFSSGAVVVLILLVMVAELVVLVFMRNQPWSSVALALAPGMAFMLALLAALNGSGWPMIALWLTLSLPLHMADMWKRGLLTRAGGNVR